MNRYSEHQKLVNRALLAMGTMEWCRVWPNATGAARAFNDPSRVISFGLKGSSDIVGILMGQGGLGAFLAVEVKSGRAVQTREQKNFQKMVETFGGVYIIFRGDKDALLDRLNAIRAAF